LSEAEGYSQFSERGGGSDPQSVIKTHLAFPGVMPCGDVEVITHNLARQMDGGNAQLARWNLGPHVKSLSLVGFGLRSITDVSVVEITTPSG
jgi:hypothetical protein